ncbi:hypothetical protein [Halomarina litorea]|uniref:hypothetical protein n=1 Tax=Halomarina litorea TaxID=2961595 RepID=UPI0020C4CE26|nr:hypothetical protein [Halomarina sp. BCD28]
MADTKRGRERKGLEKERQLTQRLYDHELASTLPEADVDVEIEPDPADLDAEALEDSLLVAEESDD